MLLDSVNIYSEKTYQIKICTDEGQNNSAENPKYKDQ